MSQLWKSQLNTGLHPTLYTMNQSIGFDIRLCQQDITGSAAHVNMLKKQGLISADLSMRLLGALEELRAELKAGMRKPTSEDEDVHAFIERVVVEKVGPEASNIHIARSRNEQVLLDVSLFLRDSTEKIIEKIAVCQESLDQKITECGDSVMPSFTHLRRAQPIFVRQYWKAHHSLWAQARHGFEGVKTLVNRECPMGSGAINGTTLNTDPGYEAQLLGFDAPTKSPLATISSRRSLLEFAGQSVHWLLDVSRLMEDLINWSSAEFGYVQLSPSVTTGSSMMPNKRNPDICELIRGKAAVAMGHYVSLMTLLKGLPMGYMKDLQEDKPLLFAIVDIVNEVLDALPLLLEGVHIDTQRTQSAAQDPLLLATDVMEWLVGKGIPLRQAHRSVADCVSRSLSAGGDFSTEIRKSWPEFPMSLLSPEKSCETRAQSKPLAKGGAL